MVILLGLLFVVPYAGAQFGLNLNIFLYLVGIPAEAVTEFIIHAVGIVDN